MSFFENNTQISLLGKVIDISDKTVVEEGKSKKLLIRSIVLEIEKYNHYIENFEVVFYNEKVEFLKNLQKGKIVGIECYVRSFSYYVKKNTSRKYKTVLVGNILRDNDAS